MATVKYYVCVECNTASSKPLCSRAVGITWGKLPPRRIVRYLKHGFLNPWQIVILAGSWVFGLASGSLLVLLAVFFGTEFLLLLFILFAPVFRKYIDGIEDNQLQRLRVAVDNTEKVRVEVLDYLQQVNNEEVADHKRRLRLQEEQRRLYLLAMEGIEEEQPRRGCQCTSCQDAYNKRLSPSKAGT